MGEMPGVAIVGYIILILGLILTLRPRDPKRPDGIRIGNVKLSEGFSVLALGAVLVMTSYGVKVLPWGNKPPPTTTTTTTATSTTTTRPSTTKPTTTTAPKLSVTLTCSAPANLRPGQTIMLAYSIEATRPVKVGLGAGLYDSGGDDHSTGDGDVDEYALAVGHQTPSRPFIVPSNLPRGRYELVAEIWPANKIGAEGANTIAEHTCAYVSIAV